MTDDDASVIALAVHTAMAPMLAKLAILEARPTVTPDVLEFLKDNAADLRQRMIAVEARPIVPGKDGKDADERVLTELKAEIASLKDRWWASPGKSDIQQIVTEQIAQIPRAKDGKDADSLVILSWVDQAVAKAVAQIPIPKDGKDADLGAVKSWVDAAVAAIPPPKNGKDGQGVTVSELVPVVAAEVAQAVAALPKAKDGTDGRAVTVDELAPVVVAEVSKAIALVPAPRDGVGLTGAVIDRDGHLVLMLSDGQTKDVGPVVGKDGSPGLNGTSVDPVLVQKQIADLVALIPIPKDGAPGRDGLGFDDLEGVFEDKTGFALRFKRGDQVRDVPIPTPFDTGVWKAGRAYEKGSGVTYKGAWWIAQWATSARPGDETPESRAWRLAVKGGRDGAPGKDGRDGIDR